MLTADVKRLRETFEAWCNGRPHPTIEAWMGFLRDLKALEFKAACVDLGIDLTVVDVAAELEKPSTNVVVFRQRQRAPATIGDGGAA